MKILKPIITIFSLILLTLALTACQPTTVEEKPTADDSKIFPKETQIDESKEEKQSACIYKDGSCCQGEQGICQIAQASCEEGKKPIIKGCNEKCEADFECVASATEEKKETAESEVTDPTADWQTFTNDLFTLKHPTAWQVKSKKSGVRNTIIFQDLKDGYPGNDYQVLSISYMPNQGGLTLADWWSEESKNSIYTKAGTAKIANIEALRLEAAETEAGPRYVFITDQTAGWIFDLSTASLNQTIIDQILSTFKLNQ